MAVPAGACGVVTTDPLRASYHPSQTPDCSSSAGALALDVGGAASLAAVEAITLRNAVTDDYARGHDVRDTGIELAGTVAVALVSTWWWLRQHDRCEAAYAAHDRWLAQRAWAARGEATPPDLSRGGTPASPATVAPLPSPAAPVAP
ncbi:MAG: hypothetical protein KC464_22380 [Myxococcales bacterium]|nr:hypothetical protein [Myxococcales bacterium]